MNSRASLLYRCLVDAAPLRRSRTFDRLWRKAWAAGTARYEDPVSTTLHGREAFINFGNPYPIVVRDVPKYNAPLVELVAQTFRQRQRPLYMIDVGAGIGDSVLLLMQRCPDAVERFLCFEGEPGFFALLRANLGHVPSVQMTFCMLSDGSGLEPALTRAQHAGTATAKGETRVPARSLDQVLADDLPLDHIDVFKVDTDGYDGKVLAGSSKTLDRYRPMVIFEWHPVACAAAGVDPHLTFLTLAACGYGPFVFFDKFGNFSHFMNEYGHHEVQSLAEFCTGSPAPPDWHYDVIALPADTEQSAVSLARLPFFSGEDRGGNGGSAKTGAR